MSTITRTRGRRTPDSHDFPTRSYDLVKEFVLALLVVVILSTVLAAVFSSPDEKSITLADWAQKAPNDVVATAAGELAGSTTSAQYGPPYNHASTGQTLGPIELQDWAGVRIPIDSANDLVITPLRGVSGDQQLSSALSQWSSAPSEHQYEWASAYTEALSAAPDGDPAAVKPSSGYGPVPVLSAKFLQLAQSGALAGALNGDGNFYQGDATRGLLLLSDGAYLEDRARAKNLGGDQWGMMNETGNYPGQPWMWLYTFWYQVKPFSTSDNADAQVWVLMMVLTLSLTLVPFIPGLRSIPRWIPLYRLIWRDYYRRTDRSG